MGDWFTIERLNHDHKTWFEPTEYGATLRDSARVSDATVEGTGDLMLALADAIEARVEARFKRCAVRVDNNKVFFWSPRNSQTEGECTLEEADELAGVIRKVVTEVNR